MSNYKKNFLKIFLCFVWLAGLMIVSSKEARADYDNICTFYECESGAATSQHYDGLTTGVGTKAVDACGGLPDGYYKSSTCTTIASSGFCGSCGGGSQYDCGGDTSKKAYLYCTTGSDACLSVGPCQYECRTDSSCSVSPSNTPPPSNGCTDNWQPSGSCGYAGTVNFDPVLNGGSGGSWTANCTSDQKVSKQKKANGMDCGVAECRTDSSCTGGGPTNTPPPGVPSNTPVPEQVVLPNCKSLSGPATIERGQSVTYNVTADNLGGVGLVDNLGIAITRNNCATSADTLYWTTRYTETGQGASSGTEYSFTLDGTKTNVLPTGTYTLDCRAWNDSISECRGACFAVSGGPYQCSGPNTSFAVNVVDSTVTLPPAGDTPTPTPINTDPYIIPIGSKDSISITIGGGGTGSGSQVKFAVKLFGVENTPEIKVRLAATDLIAQLTPPVGGEITYGCETPGTGQYFYKDLTLTADSAGVYRPKAGSAYTSGSSSITVTSDGWVTLDGVATGKPVALAVKGPKHRNMKMVDSISLTTGTPSAQDFDWTEKLLEPGDLPDPNNGSKQDCTVNSVDLSLVTARLGTTDTASLDVADVTYDSVVNGNDISQVVNTLSTKPDDDR